LIAHWQIIATLCFNVLSFAALALLPSPGNAENADIAALSDVASGVSDDEAKSEIAEIGKRQTLSCLDRPTPDAFGASGALLMYGSPNFG
jgi:hypothetical protein